MRTKMSFSVKIANNKKSCQAYLEPESLDDIKRLLLIKTI